MFTRYSIMFRNNVLTANLKHHCDEKGCWWVIDLIDSHIMANTKFRTEEFLSSTLDVVDGGFVVKITDGNENVLASQEGDFTDYPEAGLKLFTCRNELGGWTHMLPEDY